MYIAWRAVERVDAAREMATELEREVERHVPGDVGGPVAAIQPAGKVQPVDVDGAGAVPAWD